MDSMRSLDKSLPGNTSPSKQQDPPETLLDAFKAAALSVTNLYKSAAADQGRARAEGYQDALDELLSFLDREDIGLSDGEGWRIRRWATERLDGRDSVSHESDEETDKADRGSSPILQRSRSLTRLTPSISTRAASPMRTESAPPSIVTPQHQSEDSAASVPPQATFTFRSSHTYPQDADLILSDLEASDNVRGSNHDTSATSHASNPQLSGLAIPRAARPRHTSARHSRTSTTIGRGAGQKRKINLGDFFDIGNLGQGRDGSGGGGKRGRFA